MIPTPWLEVHYRSFAGDTYDAVVTNVRRDGTVDIEITVPGCRDLMARHSIRFVDGPVPDICTAWPKETK